MLYQFKDLYQKGGALRHIFPLHQKAVLDLIENLPDSVDEVWVFGSSVSLKCGQDSDLDVCLVGSLEMADTKDLWVMDRVPLDIVVTSRQAFEEKAQAIGSLYHRIKTDGLKVWERGGGLQ